MTAGNIMPILRQDGGEVWFLEFKKLPRMVTRTELFVQGDRHLRNPSA